MNPDPGAMRAVSTRELVRLDRTPLDRAGFNPYYLRTRGLNGGRPKVEGRACYDLASNDYLGLASDPDIHEAMTRALREFGSSLCGTPIATGYSELLAELERELAEFVGVEAALVFPSGYQANLALLSAVASREDLVLVDHYAHASLGQGIKAAGCRIQPFLHNRVDHLERALVSRREHPRTFVVTESVFSTEGSIAPVGEIARLCSVHGAIAVIDDSHGIGVLGPGLGGILRSCGLEDFDGIYTASLGKALGQVGGMIGGKREMIEALRYTCPGLIYSTALPPMCAGGVLAALEIIRARAGALGARLWRNHGHLVRCLAERGYPLGQGTAPIAAVQCGPAEATLALAGRFFARGVLGTPFVPPSVPPEAGVLRLIVGAKLAEPELEKMLALIPANEGPGQAPPNARP